MARLHVCHLAEATGKPKARMALSLIRDADGRFQIKPAARAAGDVVGELCGEGCGVGAVVEPAFLLDGDTGRSIGEPDAHAPDCATGLTQEPNHGIVAGPHRIRARPMTMIATGIRAP